MANGNEIRHIIRTSLCLIDYISRWLIPGEYDTVQSKCPSFGGRSLTRFDAICARLFSVIFGLGL